MRASLWHTARARVQAPQSLPLLVMPVLLYAVLGRSVVLCASATVVWATFFPSCTVRVLKEQEAGGAPMVADLVASQDQRTVTAS